MKELNEQIREALSVDPIAEMEKRMGVSYKEDESVVWASMALSQQNAKEKEGLLKLNDDTHWGITIPEFKRLLSRLGFEILLEDALSSGDVFRVCWNPEGLLLATDSYYGDKKINGGNVYCFYKGEYSAINTSGGGSVSPEGDDLFAVSKDIREGLRFFIEGLKSGGEFLPIWPKTPFLWLLSYEDSKVEGYDFKKITLDRIHRLPKHVQDAILGGKSE